MVYITPASAYTHAYVAYRIVTYMYRAYIHANCATFSVYTGSVWHLCTLSSHICGPLFSMLLFRPCAMNLSYCIQNKWYSCLIMIDELHLNVEKMAWKFLFEMNLAWLFFFLSLSVCFFPFGIYMALHSFVKLKFPDTTVVVGITLNWWCVIICIYWICLAFIGRLIIILMYNFAEWG